jgi:hypothetical protein
MNGPRLTYMAPVRVGETVDETVEDATFADGCASVDGA